MVETVNEFQDEIKTLREEIYAKGRTADVKLVASWLDRLLISLEKLSDSLELMTAEVDTMCECCSGEEIPKAAKKPAKKPAKKAAKKRR